MKISHGLWIGLAISVVAALVIMVVTFIILRHNVNKVKRKFENQQNQIPSKALYARKNHGELLWELKAHAQNPLEDVQMEFLINTALRNTYQTFLILGTTGDYEKNTLIKLAQAQEDFNDPQLIIIFNDANLHQHLINTYQKLAKGNMIAIVNAVKRKAQIKKVINHLKTIKAKYDWNPIGQGIILIVK